MRLWTRPRPPSSCWSSASTTRRCPLSRPIGTERLARFGPGLTVLRADQCPYIEDATREVIELGREYGVETRVVRLSSGQEVQASAPTAYGVFQIVYDGELVSYHYLGRKEREKLVGLLAQIATDRNR